MTANGPRLPANGSRVPANGSRVPARPDWMSIHEASTLMGVSSATLRRWSDAGEIRAFTTPGGHRRFSRAAVASLLPAEAPERPAQNARHAWSLVVGDIPWFADLDPAERRAMRRHARRISVALAAMTDATTADERAISLAEAESSAAACATLAALSGVGLRETVEAFLTFRASYLRTLVDTNPSRRDAARMSAATMEAVTRTFDRLVCGAMRAHEAHAVSSSPPSR